ncbi:MAG: hypothetical protein R6U13_15865 [Desulfatiglandaceae bacterium]
MSKAELLKIEEPHNTAEVGGVDPHVLMEILFEKYCLKMATLDDYIAKFRRHRTDRDRKRWSSLTAYQAPHKPFVLLSVIL